jgi:hypothetical protein
MEPLKGKPHILAPLVDAASVEVVVLASLVVAVLDAGMMSSFADFEQDVITIKTEASNKNLIFITLSF